jgi:aminopeptidase N
VSQLDGLDFYFRRLPSEAAYQAYARQVLNPVLARIGWSPQPGEDQNVNVLRTSLILVLGKLGDPVVVAEARARFEAYLRDPSSLTSEQRRAVLRIVARHADAAIFEQLHALAKEASTNLDKREYYFIMGLAHDETLAKQALALSLTDEVPATTRPGMLTSVAIYYPELALDFYLAHQDAYDKLLEPAVRVSFVPSLAANAFDPSTITKLEAYAAAHIPAADQGNVVQAKANFNLTQKIRVERLPEMVAWITRQVAPAPP